LHIEELPAVKNTQRLLMALISGLAATLFSLSPAMAQTLQAGPLEAIPQVVEDAVRDGQTPGAVVLIGTRGQVVFRRGFGRTDHGPKSRPTSPDTLYDIASLTKVVATTPAILQLVEKGKIGLDDPAVKFWPEFRGSGKERITIRQLLTHYSGLRPGLLRKPPWSGYEEALQKVIKDKPTQPPGSLFIYSDVNFMVLGEIVRRVAAEPLDAYCRLHIFEPLGMRDTGFNPAKFLYSRLAPTIKGSLGVVHDPDARRMGGVSGQAGLFSSANDLALFAEAILDPGRSILSPASVELMTRACSPAGRLPARGLGWAIHSPAGNWSEMMPPGSFGHKGYTGTLIWIDPETRTYLVVLSNRVYPDGEGRPDTLRDRVFSLAVQATGRPEPAKPAGKTSPPAVRRSASRVMTGVDVLAAQNYEPLSGKRVGLITNHTGLSSDGRRTIDLLAQAGGVKLAAIFTPEHGITGLVDAKVAGGRDASTQIPIYSLYGDTLRPTPAMMKGLEALVFDVQDAGARFYTYMTTMGYAMEGATRAGIEFFVLDRPNPISASRVEGPVTDADLKSFTSYFPLPVRHGMTLGELARMFNAEKRIGAKLTVVAMDGYRRAMWFDDTGLTWRNPSPNLRSLSQATLYPAVALAEASNVSVGRGTDTPFELLGAPWIDGRRLAEHLRQRKIDGVKFEPTTFKPRGERFKGQRCSGIRITVTDRQALDAGLLGVEILSALHRLYPDVFQLRKSYGLIGSWATLQAIEKGKDPREIASSWQKALDEFRPLRARHLLYPD
jgi:uncharacterized protein YbbC (DUF1343 family)/CubicO group peptidase (beta-lactamase class C family)